MKREKLKTPRGTARRLRRSDMSVFRAEREKRGEASSAGTHTFNVSTVRGGRAPERNPHHHSVATVTDMGNGTYQVRQYDWTHDYPANVPCPRRNLIGSILHFATYGAAKEHADEINRITVAGPKPLRHA